MGKMIRSNSSDGSYSSKPPIIAYYLNRPWLLRIHPKSYSMKLDSTHNHYLLRWTQKLQQTKRLLLISFKKKTSNLENF